MRRLLLICLACGAAVLPGWAQDSKPADPPAKPSSLDPKDLPLYEAYAQFTLLKDLVRQHEQRAEEATRLGQREKTEWETNLVAELNARGDALLKGLREQAKEKTETADRAKPLALSSDEVAYLAAIDARLRLVEDELAVALAESRQFSLQLQTNNTPEDMIRISYVSQDNARLLRYLQKEQTDLELKKLQLRALRKP